MFQLTNDPTLFKHICNSRCVDDVHVECGYVSKEFEDMATEETLIGHVCDSPFGDIEVVNIAKAREPGSSGIAYFSDAPKHGKMFALEDVYVFLVFFRYKE